MQRLELERLVRPRVVDRAGAGSDAVLLEDVLEQRLARREHGPIVLEGPPGSGKRTALAYVRLRFAGHPGIAVGSSEDGPEPSPESAEVLTVVAGGRSAPPSDALLLAPWTRDEWIEYLLANHHDACAGVMARLEHPGRHLELAPVPLLWTAILDELAADPGLPDDFAALRVAVRRRFSGSPALATACALLGRSLSPLERDLSKELRALGETEERIAPFLALQGVLLLLAAEGVIRGVVDPGAGVELPRQCSLSLLRVAEPLLADEPRARAELARLLERFPRDRHASAAGLLLRCGPTALAECVRDLRARGVQLPRLQGAELPGWEAPGLDLQGAQLTDAHLEAAVFDGADLTGAGLARAELALASFRGARMVGLKASGARFTGADLRGAVLDGAELSSARLDHARLEGALLQEARLEGADLFEALLDRANLRGAVLRGAHVERASFEEADLSGAILDRVDLRSAHLATRKLANASLVGCHMEGVALEAPDLSDADLTDALLTSTRFQRANLRGARLTGAGLAHVEWPDADLRDADLTQASFHLGSSRSGLVLAAPVSWGTHTGFYTDERKDLSIKHPEEIRKADLRRADLRGARIFETDFYLVDLRGAQCTADQELHLRSCGAIL